MSLKKAASKGLLWTFLDVGVSRGVGLVASILLARLLSPRDFGLMGMIYIFTALASSLVDSGLTASLIRTKNVNDKDFSTIFYTNFAVSLVLYVIVVCSAPLIASFYEEPILKDIIRVYAFIFVINALSAVQQCIFTKRLDFRSLMLMNIPGIVIGAIVGIGMALLNYKVWSIVAMQLTTHMVYSLTLWLKSNWKPSWVYSYSSLKTHFNFGYKLALSGILNSVFNNIYNVLIGKFFTTQALGQYDRAKKFNDYPVLILTSMISKVTYPLLSEIQEDTARLKKAYREIIQVVFFISAPLMLILSVIAEPLIIWVLGEKWEQASRFFSILCFAGILYPVHAFNLNLLKVYGRSDWFLKLEIIKKINILIVVILMFPFGIYGLVWSSVISSVMALFINTYYTNKLIKYSLIDQLKDISKSIGVNIVMYIVMFIFISKVNLSNLGQIIFTTFLGLLIYTFLSYVFKISSLNLIWQMKNSLKK